MSDLIERLNKATGPDWRLDHEIFAVDRGWSYPLRGAALEEFQGGTREHGLTNFTASTDAALTLLPKDTHITLSGCNQSWYAGLISTPNNPAHPPKNGFASSAARAICIAAVAARMAMAENYEPPDPPGWEGGFAENH